MKISPYELTSPVSSEKIKGVFIHENKAYSLLQSWPSLGDPSLEELLLDLKTAQKHPLVQRALELLSVDSLARSQEKILCESLSIPSHLLINQSKFNPQKFSAALESGQDLFKIKIDSANSQDASFLSALDKEYSEFPFRFRLDANLRGSKKSLESFLSSLSDKLLCRIDYIEDPFLGSAQEWLDFAQKWDLRLAHDFAPVPLREAADVWVLKPSRENPWPWVEKAAKDLRRVVISTALDHPYAHLMAAWESARLLEQYPLLVDKGGFLSLEKLEDAKLGAFPEYKRKESFRDYLFQNLLNESGFAFQKYFDSLEWVNLK